jgi:hypothetical protein
MPTRTTNRSLWILTAGFALVIVTLAVLALAWFEPGRRDPEAGLGAGG